MIKHVSPVGFVIFLHTFVIFEQLLAVEQLLACRYFSSTLNSHTFHLLSSSLSGIELKIQFKFHSLVVGVKKSSMEKFG